MQKKPILVREINEEEKQALEKACRATDACEMKRAQILLANSRGLTTSGIKRQFGLLGGILPGR